MGSTRNAAVTLTVVVASVGGCNWGGGGDNHQSPPSPLASPSFTSQPASQTVYSGGTASFSIAANGNPPPSVVWQRSNDNGATWNAINGATSSSYSFTVQPTDTSAKFRALAANSQGSLFSDPATLTEVPAVYAGGRIDVTNPYPGYWLNGTWVPLSSPAGTQAEVSGLSVSGNKVIAAGNILGSSSPSPFPTGYWLNGTWVDLALPSGYTWGVVYSLVVSGNDLYLVGELAPGGAPGYWLNGAWNGLPVPVGSVVAWAISLAVSGADVYVAGWKVSNGMALPGYWFDGTWVDLPPPSGSVGGLIESIVVSGNNVYAAGYADPTGTSYYAGNPGYWLNGSWVGLALPTGQTAGAVTTLVVSGTDVYAAGFCENASDVIPGYWLNGAWVGLAVPLGLDGGVVTSFVLSGGKVYAGGYSGNVNSPASIGSFSSTSPGYWVDGIWAALPIPAPGTGFSSVRSLTVIP